MQRYNPFERIDLRLDTIENLLNDLNIKSINQPKNSNTLINTKECAELLNISIATLYGYTSRNKIPYHKQGAKLLFFKKEIIEWVKTGRQRTISEIESDVENSLKGES